MPPSVRTISSCRSGAAKIVDGKKQGNESLQDRLFAQRDKLNLYGKTLLGLCFAELDKKPTAKLLRDNINT